MAKRSRNKSMRTPRRAQRGVSLVLVAAALATLIIMSALALDVGHATLNKTRLQNAADAAALAAAKTLDETGNTTLATTEARDAFKDNANSTGNGELSDAYASGNGVVKVDVQYSSTLPPFTAGSPTG